MKKLNLILILVTIFVTGDVLSQVSTYTNGNGAKSIYKTQGAWDHAQDVQDVFPELVTKDTNEILAVNYQVLIPVLINALNEQQKELKTIKKEFLKNK